MRAISQLLSTVRQLTQSWYSVDRIRIAPTTGRLLQLQTGDAIVLLNELYTVQQRRVESSSIGDRLSYLLIYSGGQRELTVIRQETSGSIQGQLPVDGKAIDVFDSDMTVVNSEPMLGS